MDKDNLNENENSNIDEEKELNEKKELNQEKELYVENIIEEDENLKNSEGAKSEETKPENEEIICEEKEENSNQEEDLNQETKDECKRVINKKVKITIGIIAILAVLSYIIVNLVVSKYDDIVYPGYSIYGESIVGLNKEQLQNKIDEYKNKIDKKTINIDARGNIYKLNVEDIVLSYNEDKLLNQIFKENEDKNKLQKLAVIIRKQKNDYKLDIEVDKRAIKEKSDQISKETNKKCEEPRVLINGKNIRYEKGKKGIKLDDKDFLSNIEKSIKQNNIDKQNIKISGKYIDDNPKVNIKDVEDVNYRISTFSTTYGSGGGRGRNIEIAASKIDDLLLMPGDEFSYENSVGPVTQSNGYTYAPVISNGELIQGIGGGLCQVSSTLYNTQLKAGIVPTERRNHSKAVSYVPRGLDATLATGSIDYKFKNTHKYPIVINTYASGGSLTIEFWSNKDALKGVEYKPVGYANGKVANTYLYGYDKNGKKVYEKHIDTSIYR